MQYHSEFKRFCHTKICTYRLYWDCICIAQFLMQYIYSRRVKGDQDTGAYDTMYSCWPHAVLRVVGFYCTWGGGGSTVPETVAKQPGTRGDHTALYRTCSWPVKVLSDALRSISHWNRRWIQLASICIKLVSNFSDHATDNWQPETWDPRYSHALFKQSQGGL